MSVTYSEHSCGEGQTGEGVTACASPTCRCTARLGACANPTVVLTLMGWSREQQAGDDRAYWYCPRCRD